MNIIKIIYVTIFTVLISSIDCYAQKPRKIFSHIQENNLNLALEEYAKIKSDKVYDTDEKILFEIADCIFLINKSYPKYNPILSIKYFNNIYNNLDNYFNTPKSKKEIHEFLAKYDLTFDTIANRIQTEIAFEAKKINTVESYDKALEVCSNKYRFELAQLKEEAFYLQTINERTIIAYKTFILNYSNSKHVSEIQALLERKVLDNAKIIASVNDLNKFLVEYPTSNLKQEAIDYRDSIVFSNIPNTYDTMLAFTKEFPYSKYLKGAESKLPDLLYNESIELNTVESLKRFINEFPNDLRVDDIYKKLAEIKYTEISINKINNLDINCNLKIHQIFNSHIVSLIIGELNGKKGIIDKNGKSITPFKYDEIIWDERNVSLFEVELDGKKGILNNNGKEIIPIIYDNKKFKFEIISEGIVIISEGFEISDNKKFGFFDVTGKEIIPFGKYNFYTECGSPRIFQEGIQAVELNKECGLIDIMGNIIIPFGRYNNIGDIKDGLIKVELNGKFGFIDNTGKEIVPLKYDRSNIFNYYIGPDFICLCKDYDMLNHNNFIPGRRFGDYSRKAIFDKTGKEILLKDKNNLEIDLYNSGKLIAHKTDSYENISTDERKQYKYKYGLIDTTGKEILPFEYDDMYFDSYLGYGLYLFVYKNGKFGVFDIEGKSIIQVKYDKIEDIIETSENDSFQFWFRVWVGKKCGIVDENGKIIIPIKYDYIEMEKGFFKIVLNQEGYNEQITDGFFWMKNNTSDSFFDKTFDGYLHVGTYINDKNPQKIGVIDKAGKLIIPIKYDFLSIESDIFKVHLDGKVGAINKNGMEIISMGRYDGIDNLFDNIIVVRLNNKRGVIDMTGKTLIPLIYDNINYLFSNDVKKLTDNEKFNNLVKHNINYCHKSTFFINFNHKYEFSPICHALIVESNGNKGVFDKTGKEIIPIGKYEGFNEKHKLDEYNRNRVLDEKGFFNEILLFNKGCENFIIKLNHTN
jgi:hypothetical protein